MLDHALLATDPQPAIAPADDVQNQLGLALAHRFGPPHHIALLSGLGPDAGRHLLRRPDDLDLETADGQGIRPVILHAQHQNGLLPILHAQQQEEPGSRTASHAFTVVIPGHGPLRRSRTWPALQALELLAYPGLSLRDGRGHIRTCQGNGILRGRLPVVVACCPGRRACTTGFALARVGDGRTRTGRRRVGTHDLLQILRRLLPIALDLTVIQAFKQPGPLMQFLVAALLLQISQIFQHRLAVRGKPHHQPFMRLRHAVFGLPQRPFPRGHRLVPFDQLLFGGSPFRR